MFDHRNRPSNGITEESYKIIFDQIEYAFWKWRLDERFDCYGEAKNIFVNEGIIEILED